MKRRISLIFLAVILALISFLAIKGTNIPFIGLQKPAEVWSIAIYTAANHTKAGLEFSTPLHVQNPVLTANDITDRRAVFVADPFIAYNERTYYLFFEVYNSQQGDIGLASSKDGIHWAYEGIVLDEPFHLSFPYVFRCNNQYYMIPESNRSGFIRLYEAVEFPRKWRFVKNIIPGSFIDPVIFFKDNRWWLMASQGTSLYIFYSDFLLGEWHPHQNNPVIKNSRVSGRNGGNVFLLDGWFIRTAQKCFPSYGKSIGFYKIKELTTQSYREEFMQSVTNFSLGIAFWNQDGIHQFSALSYENGSSLSVFDGKRYANSGALTLGSRIQIKTPLSFFRILEKLNFSIER